MALARTKYGIEFNPRQMEEKSSPIGWIVALVAVATLVSLTVTLVSRYRSEAEELPPPAADEEAMPAEVEEPTNAVAAAEAAPAETRTKIEAAAVSDRPARLRNLLLRLEEAERRRDVQMAVTTIESIRALPGSPAADLDDALARRLGNLNVRWLFRLHNAQWVRQITVRRGDSASRLAAENGSTHAAFSRLNDGKVDQLKTGAKVYVMDHPRFNLVVHRRLRTADLQLNGKFFRRYDLTAPVRAGEGAYTVEDRSAKTLRQLGLVLKGADSAELEMLLPKGATITVSEM